jgi:hypothetical protein
VLLILLFHEEVKNWLEASESAIRRSAICLISVRETILVAFYLNMSRFSAEIADFLAIYTTETTLSLVPCVTTLCTKSRFEVFEPVKQLLHLHLVLD